MRYLIKLEGGPAAGDYEIGRLPRFLRGVAEPRRTPTVKPAPAQVLDLLDDVPEPQESIGVYEIDAGSRGAPMMVCYRGKNKKLSGQYEVATYQYRVDVDGEAVRATAAWREWCVSQGTGSQAVNMATGEYVSI